MRIGYDNLPLPFYKNFYLGGIGTVRGYEQSSIGPKDAIGNALGGPTRDPCERRVLFPISRACRRTSRCGCRSLSTAGEVSDNFDLSQTRFATGVGAELVLARGPNQDQRRQRRSIRGRKTGRKLFQFSLGTTF